MAKLIKCCVCNVDDFAEEEIVKYNRRNYCYPCLEEKLKPDEFDKHMFYLHFQNLFNRKPTQLEWIQLDKMIDSSVGNMLSCKLGDKFMIERLVSENKLMILPMCDIRGFDTGGLSCGVYITEAQNLDISLMKLALQRIGEDSVCVIEGDYNTQVDSQLYAGKNNGMRRMSEVFRGHSVYGEVELQNIYRSEIAEIAQEM